MNELLNKYFEGSTSLTEEQQLREYFLSDKVAQEHAHLVALFSLKNTNPKEVPDFAVAPLIAKKQGAPKGIWYSIAASAAVIIMLFWLLPKPNPTTDLGSYDDPHLALQKTIEALQLVSENMNKGTTAMSYMNELEHKTHKVFSLNY
ncbi:MAG: hypothetical protein RQ756_08750 [Flavobacteriaceae bacterium]|nr:hypothetical protein [Flavobacteriaceae bacterium]